MVGIKPELLKKLYYHGMDSDSLQRGFLDHIEFTLAKDHFTATDLDRYMGLAYAMRDSLIKRWVRTQESYYTQDAKRVYYLSLEFLMGRMLGNSLINLGLMEECQKAMDELGFNLNELSEHEWDPGLGNGGLGRLAACFLDSLA